MALQLGAAGEDVAAKRAAEALLVLLVTILDVFLQRRHTFVAAVAVRTGEQLGEVVRCVVLQFFMQQSEQTTSFGSLIYSGNVPVSNAGGSNLCRTVFTLILPGHLRCGQPGRLFWGFWVNDGSVTAL